MKYHQFFQLVEWCVGGCMVCFDLSLDNIVDAVFSKDLASMDFIGHLNAGLWYFSNVTHQIHFLSFLCDLPFAPNFLLLFLLLKSLSSLFSSLLSKFAQTLTALIFRSIAIAMCLAQRNEERLEQSRITFLVFAGRSNLLQSNAIPHSGQWDSEVFSLIFVSPRPSF